jgi:hypothetical protein
MSEMVLVNIKREFHGKVSSFTGHMIGLWGDALLVPEFTFAIVHVLFLV